MDFNVDGKKVEELIDLVMGSYTGDKYIDKENTFDHPDTAEIIHILDNLQKIVFLGFFRNKNYRVYTMRNSLSMLLEDVIFNMIKQITFVLKFDDKCGGCSEIERRDCAEKTTIEFIKKIPTIREYIETDVQAEFDGDPAAFNKDEIIFSYPGMYATLVYRIAHELYQMNVPLIPRIMTEHAHSKTGIDINPGATIGKYFFIDHGTGIVIGETTVIGENVKVYQGVTLGALSTRGGQRLKNKKRHPTIEDNVTIYSGASILGGDTIIGEGAVIGGNTFITSSVPAGARVNVKNQELIIKYDKDKAPEHKELDQDDTWYYII
ncbi:MAG: serine acetyltransferase [Lachnospiraceae bacterium]|nr:serine acetyltransferase [Lachnospiraceae bacterium]